MKDPVQFRPPTGNPSLAITCSKIFNEFVLVGQSVDLPLNSLDTIEGTVNGSSQGIHRQMDSCFQPIYRVVHGPTELIRFLAVRSSPTAVCVSIDHSLQNRAPNRCLPFDGIGAQCLHCDVINVTGSVTSQGSVCAVTADDPHNFPGLPDHSLDHHQSNRNHAGGWKQTAHSNCYKRADGHTTDPEVVEKSTNRLSS